MNLNHLRVFHAVAGVLSFTRAAEELHLTQPGISKHVKELEEQYGTRLFDRLGKRVALTQAGEILFGMTSDVFRLIGESKVRIDDLNGLTSGKLIIGACATIGTYILPDMLVRFRQRYPGIEIKVDTAFNCQIVEGVLGTALELGFVGNYVPDARLSAQPFMTDRMVLIVSVHHPWADRKSPVHLRELIAQPFLLSKPGSGTWKTVAGYLEKAGIRLTNTMELGTTEAVKQAVASNLGVSILAEHVLSRELADGVIKSVPVAGEALLWDLYFVYHKDRYLSGAARAFLELAGMSPPYPSTPSNA